MLSVIRMPQMGVSDESAILSKWLVCEGDSIRKGQPVFSLETDKATFQYEAETDGFLVRILTGESDEAAVGSPVGILSDTEAFENSELEALLNELKTPDERPQTQTEVRTERPCEDCFVSGPERASVQNKPNDNRKISPRARKKADELGMNSETIRSGSGPDGRIIERDILNTVQAAQADYGFERKTCGIWSGRPLTIADRVKIRQVCAEGTGQPGFVSRVFDARNALEKCTPQNELMLGAVICHELAQLLVKTPELNARRHGDKVYEYNTVQLRLNVETSFGTLKPVIRCAEAYTENELAVLMRNATERCKRFTSKPQAFQGGTFNVTDLSGYGIDSFTPELTPPELCALGIGAVTMQTRVDERGEIEVYPVIRLTLVYDRAGIDSLRAAKFLNELAFQLEKGKTKH